MVYVNQDTIFYLKPDEIRKIQDEIYAFLKFLDPIIIRRGINNTFIVYCKKNLEICYVATDIYDLRSWLRGAVFAARTLK